MTVQAVHTVQTDSPVGLPAGRKYQEHDSLEQPYNPCTVYTGEMMAKSKTGVSFQEDTMTAVDAIVEDANKRLAEKHDPQLVEDVTRSEVIEAMIVACLANWPEPVQAVYGLVMALRRGNVEINGTTAAIKEEVAG